MSRDISVGIATSYVLGSPEFESRQSKIFFFSETSWPALGPIQPPVQWVQGSFPRGKAAGPRI